MGGGTALKYLLANWKMHTTVDPAVTLIRAIQEGLWEPAAAEAASQVLYGGTVKKENIEQFAKLGFSTAWAPRAPASMPKVSWR